VGTAGETPPSPWVTLGYLNTTGITIQTPQTLAGLNLASNSPSGAPHIITTTQNSASGQQAQPDADLGTTATLRWPRYGSQDAMVNIHSSTNFNNGQNVNLLSQTVTIGAASVDPLDGQVHLRFVFAPVLQNPAHTPSQQPYYFIQVTDITQNVIAYSQFGFGGQPGIPWQSINSGLSTEIDYTDWQLVDVPGNSSTGLFAMGDQVQIMVMASGCEPGGHFGEIYVDGVGTAPPGIFINGSAPASVSGPQNITYDMVVRNNSAAPETGVVVSFTTPPSTTFQSLIQPLGFVCTPLAVGQAGTVTCTSFSPFAAGAGTGLSVTVGINSGYTGSIVFSSYSVSSTQERTILGNQLTTVVQ
jgi:uncharacterized repeat protein (TIGR01451 family)